MDIIVEQYYLEQYWHIMYNSIVAAADIHCPERNIRLKSVRPGWMTI